MTAPMAPTPSRRNRGAPVRQRTNLTRALWAVQALLAIEFLFTGGMKLLLPLATMEASMPVPLPGLFIHFLGVCELLGALGLILPGLLRTWPRLTPVAATGLVIIMIGATAFTLRWDPAVEALMPAVTGLFAAFVAYDRWRLAPLRGPSRLAALRPSPARG